MAGYVVDAAGRPIAGAHVWASWEINWVEQHGRLVSTNQQRTVETNTNSDGSYLMCGLTRGAQIVAKVGLAGRNTLEDRLVVPPTLVLEPGDDALLMREEIFGPILPVKGYGSLDEAIAYVNTHPRPLALYPFSRDGENIERILARTRSGGVTVNDTLVHFGVHALPFGGIGPSGMGNYHGRAGFRTFSHERAVLRQQGNPMSRWLAPPYGARMNRIVARLARWLE